MTNQNGKVPKYLIKMEIIIYKKKSLPEKEIPLTLICSNVIVELTSVFSLFSVA